MYAYVDSDSASGTPTGASVGPIDLAGANLIVMALSWYGPGSISSGPEDGVNTYVPLTAVPQASGVTVQLFYCFTPDVSSALTFTITGTGIYASLAVAGFSGAGSSPVDVEGGNTVTDSSINPPGTIDPSEDDELLVTAVEIQDEISGLGIDLSFIFPEWAPYVSGNCFGLGLAYLIQGSAAAVAPTWSWTGVSNSATTFATFKAEAEAGATPLIQRIQRSNLIWR